MQRLSAILALVFAFAALAGVSTAHAHRFVSTPIVVLNLVDAHNQSIPVMVKVQRGEIVSQLEFSGRISPQVEEDLFFRTDGRVKTVLAKRNEIGAQPFIKQSFVLIKPDQGRRQSSSPAEFTGATERRKAASQ